MRLQPETQQEEVLVEESWTQWKVPMAARHLPFPMSSSLGVLQVGFKHAGLHGPCKSV